MRELNPAEEDHEATIAERKKSYLADNEKISSFEQ